MIQTQQNLEMKLSQHTGYQEIILIESLQSAFYIALSTLPKNSKLLCSPNAPLELFFAISQIGLHTHYSDLRLDGTLEERLLERSLDEETSAIVLSHHYGILSETQKAVTLAEQKRITLIEDASQAFDKKDKSGASVVVFSLDAFINPEQGEGAFLATDDLELAKRLRDLARGGFQQTKLWNYDLLTPQPARHLKTLALEYIFDHCSKRKKDEEQIAFLQQHYIEQLHPNKLLELPQREKLTPYPLFPIALTPALFCPKEDIYEALIAAGIFVQVGNKPIYKTTAFKDDTLSLFGAEEIFKAQLLLPCHLQLKEQELLRIIETLQNILETYSYRGCSF